MILVGAVQAQSLDPYANETEAERDARMAWFREARFGLFIHWGVYAVPAGTYKGEQIGGIDSRSEHRATQGNGALEARVGI